MNKLLQKTLKESIKKDECILGSKQVLASLKDSKLLVVSESITDKTKKNVQEHIEKDKIPTVNFKGTSVGLGRLCGLPFRISIISFKSIVESKVQSILSEEERT